MRRRGIKALAGMVGAALVTVLGPVGSAHATGFYDCPSGYFCGWDRQDAAGQMIKLNTSKSTLGTWDRRIQSWTNRSSQWACLYDQQNFQLGTVDSEQPDAPLGSGTGYNAGVQIRSIKFVGTERECTGNTPYAQLYATLRPHASGFGDMNGDGYADLITRDTAGRLWYTSGKDGSGRLIGSGWNSMTAITRHGDFTGDGKEDLIARDSSGRLWLYPGDGSGGLRARTLIGTGGWNAMTKIAAVGDFNGDGHNDLLALSNTGTLYLYPGDGHGHLGARRVVKGSFGGSTALVGVGDINGDGHPDFLIRTKAGNLWAVLGNGHGGVSGYKYIGSGWNITTDFVGAGDVTGDGLNDLITNSNIPLGNGIYNVGIGQVSAGTGKGGFKNRSGGESWWGLNGVY